MSNRRNKKNHLKKILILSVLIFAIITVHNYLFQLDPQKIVEKSELGKNTFSTVAVEIESPVSGVKAYLFEEHTNPIISISFLFSGAGSISDKEGKEGLANLTSQIITEGAGGYNSQNFKEELENNAITINYTTTKDNFSGHILTLKENSDKAWELFKLTLSEPHINSADLKRIKENLLITLQSQQENPQTRLSLLANETIYGSHPYGKNPLGSKDTIGTITAADIRDFIKSHLSRSNLYVGIAGNITVDEAERLLDNLFGFLPEKAYTAEPAQPVIDFSQRVDIDDNLPQTVSFMAAKGTRRLAPDFYPLYIANYIIGASGLNSRLNKIAREKEGLTYGIYTGLINMDKADLIVGNFSSTPENFQHLKEMILNIWKIFGKKGITKKELDEAKKYLISSYNLRFADLTTISDMMVYMQKDKLGLDFLQKRNTYIESVSLNQVNEAAEKYYKPEELIIISLGKFNKDGENE